MDGTSRPGTMRPALAGLLLLGALLPACASTRAFPSKAGAAAVAITPSVSAEGPPVWIAGFGQGRRATGVHDDLYARAFAWTDGTKEVALVAVDLVGLFRDRVLSIRR